MFDIVGNIISAFILYLVIYLVSMFISKTVVKGFVIAFIISAILFIISFLDAYGLSNKVSVLITQVLPLWIINKYAWKLAHYRTDDTHNDHDTYDNYLSNNEHNYFDSNEYQEHQDNDYHRNDGQNISNESSLKPSYDHYNDVPVSVKPPKKANPPRPKFSFNNCFTTLHKQDSKYNQILKRNEKSIKRLIIQTNQLIQSTEQIIEQLGAHANIYPKAEFEQFKIDFDNFRYDRWNQLRGNSGEDQIANHIFNYLHLVPLTNVILPINYGNNQSTNQIDILLVCTNGIFAFESKNYNVDYIEIRGKITKNGKYEYERVFNYAKNKYVSIPVQYIYNDKYDDISAANYKTIGHQTYMHKQAIIYNLLQNNLVGLSPDKLDKIVYSPLIYINNSKSKNFYRGNKIPQDRNNRVIAIASDEITEWLNKWHHNNVLSHQQVKLINDTLADISKNNEEKRYDHYLFKGGPREYTHFIDSWTDFNEQLKTKYL